MKKKQIDTTLKPGGWAILTGENLGKAMVYACYGITHREKSVCKNFNAEGKNTYYLGPADRLRIEADNAIFTIKCVTEEEYVLGAAEFEGPCRLAIATNGQVSRILEDKD